MSNVECNVVRDLMPLCIDDAASEESQMTVREHVAVCSACAEVFHEMQAKLNASVLPVEDKTMDEAAKKSTRKGSAAWWSPAWSGWLLGFCCSFLSPI